MRIKICGLTRQDQAMAIAELGVTDIGFICVKKSPRYITVEQIATITHALPEAIGKVGVFANQSPEEMINIIQQGQLTTAQLHGDESPDLCHELRLRLPDIELIKALRIRDRASLAMTQKYEPVVDALLLDAYDPQQLGGTGHTLNWQDLQTFNPTIPWLLAGGLKPSNIQEALAQLQPNGIDLSSGVENSPGDKNIDLVKALMEKLRTLEHI